MRIVRWLGMTPRSPIRGSSIFVIAVLAIPMIYVPGIGNWVREPKLIVLMLASALAMIATAHRTRHLVPRRDRVARGVAAVAVTILALQLATARIAVNVGSFAIAIAVTTSAIGIGWVVYRTNASRSTVATASAVVAVALAVCAVFELYFGVSWFGRELFVGLPVGGRNYLPTVLAAMLPVVEARLVVSARRSQLARIASFVGLFAIVVVALAFRTRTVWLVLAMQAVVLWGIAIRHRPDRGFRRHAIVHTLVLAAAVTMIAIVPTRLHWTAADHPYLESLSSFGESQSSGRDSIWHVVTSEIAAHPVRGIGAGQYPVLARTLVENHAPDPEVFAFSTTDSPAFNDYLQITCEIGVLGGALFAILYLVVPGGLLCELFRRRSKETDEVAAATEVERLPFCLSLVSIAVGAVFANSVDRPEQIGIFAVYLAVALRSRPTREERVARSGRGVSIGIATLAIVPLVIGAALVTRYLAFPTPLERGLHSPYRMLFNPSVAYTVWPWDKYWNSTEVGYYLSRDPDVEFRRRHATARVRYWPRDPDALLIAAHSHESTGELLLAREEFREAAFEVPGGRCRLDHAHQLEMFLGRHQMPAEGRDRAIQTSCAAASRERASQH